MTPDQPMPTVDGPAEGRDPAAVIATALAAEVVCVAGLRLRPASDHDMAANVIAALINAGFDIMQRHQPSGQDVCPTVIERAGMRA